MCLQLIDVNNFKSAMFALPQATRLVASKDMYKLELSDEIHRIEKLYNQF